MKITNPFLQRAAGLAAATVLGALRRTIDWRAVHSDPRTDTVHPLHSERYLYLGWHEYLLMPIALRGSRRMLALASNHSDGELISRAMHHLGWGVTRGSSSRGGTGALLRLLRDDTRHLNLTPDGPRGPRRTMAPGAMFLASKLNLPIVCVGYGYDRPWRAKNWDKFAVPRPFSNARAVFGPPLRVPSGVDRAGLELYRLWFEKLLNWLTAEAESWAESGRRKAGETPMLPGYTPLAMYRAPEPTAPALPAELAAEWEAIRPASVAA